MIEKWLKEDIDKTFKRGYNRFVISDPKGEIGYLCDHLPQDWSVFKANSDIEELEAKYCVERDHPKNPVVFYTLIPIEKLSFLMEYAMIAGHLDMSEYHQYIKKKVHNHIGLNLEMAKEDLLTAAKVSVGKGKAYWMDLSHKGSGEIFDLKTMLPEFLHDPKDYCAQMDAEIKQAFLTKVQEHIGQQPLKKPAHIVAKETAMHILDGLVHNNIDDTLLQVYHHWNDSATFQSSLNIYIRQFKLPVEADNWAVHPDHPFAEIDRLQTAEVAANLGDDEFIESRLSIIRARATNKNARLLTIDWWPHVLSLISFDSSGIKTISSFKEAIQYYRETFYKLDRAIRKLYAQFLSDEKVIQPLQDRYEALIQDLLYKWFEYFEDYKESQTGLIDRLIADGNEQVAIIVGDGISYEVAREVSDKIRGKLKTSEDFILADLPSVTDNNMSRLYLADGSFSDNKHQREQQLNLKHSDKIIKHVYLEDLNQTHTECHVLVCSYKDIDNLAEKLQQKALKYFDKIVATLVEKIEELGNLGFSKIYLISDHGFVMSGLLNNADKLEFLPTSKATKSERFIACADSEKISDSLLQVKKEYRGYDYLVLSKNLRPFKTSGSYGYAHGGASPQELIVPLFLYQSEKTTPQLSVIIENREDLNEVEGQNFQITVKAGDSEGNLFKAERLCQLKVFADGKEKYSSDNFILQSGNRLSREFTFGSDRDVIVYLIDAQSQEQLDKAIIIRASGRDLEGLF